MKVRRVVTGHTEDGKSVVIDDVQVEGIAPIVPGAEFHWLWAQDEVPMLPLEGILPPPDDFFPGPGGFRFSLLTLPPDSSLKSLDAEDLARALAEYEAKLPGFLRHTEPENPGMHTSDTVDLDYVISGEVWLELDDGHEVHLKAGDLVIQNGTRHAWRNRGSEPCRMVICLIGARRTQSPKPSP